MVITPELITDIRCQFHLNWQGIHGISHWARVYENGLKLAAKTHEGHLEKFFRSQEFRG